MGYLKDILIRLDERGYRRWEGIPPRVLVELDIVGLAPASGPLYGPVPKATKAVSQTAPTTGTGSGDVDPVKVAAAMADLDAGRATGLARALSRQRERHPRRPRCGAGQE